MNDTLRNIILTAMVAAGAAGCASAQKPDAEKPLSQDSIAHSQEVQERSVEASRDYFSVYVKQGDGSLLYSYKEGVCLLEDTAGKDRYKELVLTDRQGCKEWVDSDLKLRGIEQVHREAAEELMPVMSYDSDTGLCVLYGEDAGADTIEYILGVDAKSCFDNVDKN